MSLSMCRRPRPTRCRPISSACRYRPIPGEACYIPIGHRVGADDLFGGGGLVPDQIREEDALALLKPLMEAPGVLKIGHDVKFGMQVFAHRGVTMAPVDDTMLISYALDGGLAGVHGMDELAEKTLGHKPIALNEVAGSGRNFVGFARVATDKATEYAAENADVVLRLWRALKPRLAAEHVTTVYETLERPLVPVLARMERRGVAIDRDMLSRLAGDFAQAMARLEDEIAKMVGAPFNPGSPKQLGDILFGKMGLPGGKRTATGAWSTTASVLEDLAAEGHQLPARILEWRQVSKLKSTYADALPGYVNPQTGRVHTSYALAATTTGRLSSSEPNLQNIPVRTEEGRKIRRAFVAPRGHKLISADYSQIELRLLAHVADIPALKNAFAEGLDIHAMTASEMFGVPIAGMPGEMRRRAKAINFGIIYGISAFGLANQLSIPREEAGAYIRKYFERFPGIRAYMDATKKAGARQGLRDHDLRPQVPLSAHQRLQRLRARLQRARGDQRADAGLGRRHHPPRHDRAWTTRSARAGLQRAHAAAGARRTGVRGARRGGRGDPAGGGESDGGGGGAGDQAARAAAGGRARGGELGGGALRRRAPSCDALAARPADPVAAASPTVGSIADAPGFAQDGFRMTSIAERYRALVHDIASNSTLRRRPRRHARGAAPRLKGYRAEDKGRAPRPIRRARSRPSRRAASMSTARSGAARRC